MSRVTASTQLRQCHLTLGHQILREPVRTASDKGSNPVYIFHTIDTGPVV